MADTTTTTDSIDSLVQKRGRGRPRGSKNKPRPIELMTFLTSKEKGDMELSLQLRRDGVISEPGLLF